MRRRTTSRWWTSPAAPSWLTTPVGNAPRKVQREPIRQAGARRARAGADGRDAPSPSRASPSPITPRARIDCDLPPLGRVALEVTVPAIGPSPSSASFTGRSARMARSWSAAPSDAGARGVTPVRRAIERRWPRAEATSGAAIDGLQRLRSVRSHTEHDVRHVGEGGSSLHRAGAEPAERVVFGEARDRHQPALGPLDHLSIGKLLPERPRGR